jgi:hypothetical protein
MNCHHLVRTEYDFRMRAPLAVPARDFLDEGHMVRTEIRKNILDPDVRQSLKEVMRGAVHRHGGLLIHTMLAALGQR